MNEFKYIENKEMWPKESQHVEYAEVYRAVKSTEKLSVEDFMPWNIEHANQKRLFKNKFKQPEYGMSVFTSLESLKKKVSEFLDQHFGQLYRCFEYAGPFQRCKRCARCQRCRDTGPAGQEKSRYAESFADR